MSYKYQKSSDYESEEIAEEKEQEMVSINATEFETETKSDIDTERFVYHPEDGSVSIKVDDNGCPYGTHWDGVLGRCVQNKEK